MEDVLDECLDVLPIDSWVLLDANELDSVKDQSVDSFWPENGLVPVSNNSVIPTKVCDNEPCRSQSSPLRIRSSFRRRVLSLGRSARHKKQDEDQTTKDFSRKCKVQSTGAVSSHTSANLAPVATLLSGDSQSKARSELSSEADIRTRICCSSDQAAHAVSFSCYTPTDSGFAEEFGSPLAEQTVSVAARSTCALGPCQILQAQTEVSAVGELHLGIHLTSGLHRKGIIIDFNTARNFDCYDKISGFFRKHTTLHIVCRLKFTGDSLRPVCLESRRLKVAVEMMFDDQLVAMMSDKVFRQRKELEILVEERRFSRQRTLGCVIIDVSQIKAGDRISDLYPAFTGKAEKRVDEDGTVCTWTEQDASVL